MCIWNKILVGLISVAALVFFYMAARTLKTHQYWEESAQKHQQRIEQLEKQNVDTQVSIRQRRIELNELLLDRGRVWYRCDPKLTINKQDGSVTVTVAIESPDPHSISDKTILYGFEEADIQKKGHYLGEFKVTLADPKQKTVVLVPTLPLSPRQIDRLATSQRPWDLYEILPRDNHDVFASLTDAEKEEMLPPGSRQEYINDGKNDYVRPLRDYQVLFSIDNLRRTLLVDKIDATERDLKLVKDALDQAKQQEEAVKRDVASAKEDVQKFNRQREAVISYLKSLEKEYEAVKAAVSQLIEENRAKAGQIAKQQWEASRRIDERTRVMAQSGAGG
jgi:hypothetical protein